MIVHLLVFCVIIAILSLFGQQYADHYSKDNESFRKLFHVMHGLTLAGLAFIVPTYWIVMLESLFFIEVIIIRYMLGHDKIMPKLTTYMSRAYKVGRVSYGEFFYPVSVILLVLLADSKWEFAASVLILGLADTAAAMIGRKYGKSSTYKVFGQKKSLAGSLAFFIVCLATVAIFTTVAPNIVPANTITIVLVTLLITISENVGIYGSDNLLVPITAVLLLNAL